MGLLYRKDIFDKYGITPPKTWDDFAAAARKLHSADPKVYITNMAPTRAASGRGCSGRRVPSRSSTPRPTRSR